MSIREVFLTLLSSPCTSSTLCALISNDIVQIQNT